MRLTWSSNGWQRAYEGRVSWRGPFAHLPANKTYEWYLEALKEMAEEQSEGEGEGGGQGDGDPFGGADSFDHDQFGEGDSTTQEIAKERPRKL